MFWFVFVFVFLLSLLVLLQFADDVDGRDQNNKQKRKHATFDHGSPKVRLYIVRPMHILRESFSLKGQYEGASDDGDNPDDEKWLDHKNMRPHRDAYGMQKLHQKQNEEKAIDEKKNNRCACEVTYSGEEEGDGPGEGEQSSGSEQDAQRHVDAGLHGAEERVEPQ